MNTLRDLYQTHLNRIADFVQSFPDEGLQGPLLMDPAAYFRQQTKLLVIGQETGGWLDDYNDIDAQLDLYRKFNLGDKWQGPFWNITRKVESALGIERCSCAWTNLNRFDHDGEPPTGAVLEAMPALDFLVREEIQILRPTFVYFIPTANTTTALRRCIRAFSFRTSKAYRAATSLDSRTPNFPPLLFGHHIQEPFA